MKKFISYIMIAFVIVAFATPLVSASSETGSGSTRTVTFNDSFVDTNTTVVVPTILNNETNNSFAFVVVDESGGVSEYTFNITVYDNNATWYNETVDITTVADENVTGYINFTANTFDLVDDANITITMQWSNWTATNDDVWYGTVDIVDDANYQIRVVTSGLLISVLGFGLVILFIGKVLGSMSMDGKGKKKK